MYSAQLTGTLRASYDSARSAEDVLLLDDELALLRAAVSQVVELWSSATALSYAATDSHTQMRMQSLATAINEQVRRAINDVRVMAESVAKIRVMNANMPGAGVSAAGVISSVIHKLSDLDGLSDLDTEQAEHTQTVINLLETELSQQGQQVLGTSLTPADVSGMVIDMDSTIPHATIDNQRAFARASAAEHAPLPVTFESILP